MVNVGEGNRAGGSEKVDSGWTWVAVTGLECGSTTSNGNVPACLAFPGQLERTVRYF